MILVDAGPLVALVDAADEAHLACASTLREIREPLATVWPVVTEAVDRLRGVPPGQRAVLEMVRRGAVRLIEVGVEDVPRLQELMRRYRDRPMDLAEAALVRAAEREGLEKVFTLDRQGFETYRIGGRKAFRILPEALRRRG